MESAEGRCLVGSMSIFIGPMLLMLLWRHSVGRHTAIRFDHRAVIETHLDILLRGLAPDRIK